jgi:hypothetical protein
MVKAARSFKKLQEILSDAKKKHGKTLVADVIDVVTRFCDDDEISKPTCSEADTSCTCKLEGAAH